MDALMGMGGLGGFQPPVIGIPTVGGMPANTLPNIGGGASPLGLGGLGDGFMASPELAGGFGDASHPWASGKTGFEGLDVNMPLGGGGGMPDFSSLMGGMGDMGGALPGMDMMSGLGGGSLANQAAGLQSAMMDNNLANAALLGAEAVGQKNGALQGQILGDAANYGLG